MLVVDNDRDLCSILADILEGNGYSVEIAYNGESALKKLKKHRHDMMILDYKLYGASGLTVLEKARQIKPSIRTIMISGFGDSFTKTRAKELGAYAFLDKPFDINKLAITVKRVLKRQRPLTLTRA
jgi:two-component system, NtrC family, nitrogen regulation response regulator NtrX